MFHVSESVLKNANDIRNRMKQLIYIVTYMVVLLFFASYSTQNQIYSVIHERGHYLIMSGNSVSLVTL